MNRQQAQDAAAYTALGGMYFDVMRARRERDDLLAALRRIAEYTGRDGDWPHFHTAGQVAGHVHQIARAALESADGEAGGSDPCTRGSHPMRGAS